MVSINDSLDTVRKFLIVIFLIVIIWIVISAWLWWLSYGQIVTSPNVAGQDIGDVRNLLNNILKGILGNW
jgi:hypothetical protein